MLGARMQEALNGQLNAEAYSGYLYLSMASYFESLGLTGFANWMYMQAREEFFHTSKFYKFIVERGGRVLLQPIEGPGTQWASPLAAFEDAYRHEQKVTGLINGLVDLALEEKDHATNIFLQWFVTEQVEEESSVDAVIQQLRLTGDSGPGLFMVDKNLATRTISPLVAAVMTGVPVTAA